MQRAQYADLKVYLPNDPLVKVDRMSMAHSLEIRCPLLDHRLVELAFRIPTAQQDAERPAEVAAARVWPSAGCRSRSSACRSADSRRRSAHGSPVRTPSSSATTCSAPPRASRDIVDTARVARLFDEHRSGRADHSFALWAVWMLERWARAESATA